MDLKARFLSRWVLLNGGGTVVCDDVVRRYSEGHRAYHTLEHLAHCFTELDIAKEFIHMPRASMWTAIEHALWFHDVIYDTHRSDNECKSAEYATYHLRAADMPALFVRDVERLVLATAHTGTAVESIPIDEQTMLDIDLAIFGQSWARFARYEDQVGLEFAWVERRHFREKRMEVLESFLKRPRIYHTDFLFYRYEERARENLTWSIDRLAKAG